MEKLEHIIQRAQQGDRKASGQLYTVCQGSLRALCLRYVHNEAVADDLLHDSFVLIFSRIGELKDTSKAEAWMKTVTRNVALLYLRECQRQPTLPLSEAGKTLAVTAAERSPVTYDDILRMVDSLPEGYRQVFRLSVLEGLSHQQIADMLHIDPHSSSSQLYRARVALRRMLRPLLLLLFVALLPLAHYLHRRHSEPAPWSEATRRAVTPAPVRQTASVPDDAGDAPVRQVIQPTTEKTPNVAVVQTQKVAADTSAAVSQVPEPELHHVGQVADRAARQTAHHSGPRSGGTRWTLALAYSGFSNKSNLQLPHADTQTNTGFTDSLTHHRLPLTLSLSLHYQLSDHWQVGTGLQYTLLKTETRLGTSNTALHKNQTVQYLGIPVSISWHHPLGRCLQVYSSAGLTLHLPLRSTVERVYMLDGHPVDPATVRLHPGVQWSVDFGLGAEYRVLPHVGVFVEPALHHYFDSHSGVETWNTAHPLTFSLPVGLRLSW